MNSHLIQITYKTNEVILLKKPYEDFKLINDLFQTNKKVNQINKILIFY